MLEGKIVQVGSPEELYHRPASRTIADFVGDVQFLPGLASGRRARTVLGEIPLHGAFEGPVDVMLRPEMLRLSPAAAPEHHEGTPRRSSPAHSLGTTSCSRSSLTAVSRSRRGLARTAGSAPATACW